MTRATIFALALWGFLVPQSLFAVITTTGEVLPDPLQEGETVTVARGTTGGDLTFGTLTINGGSALNSDDGIVGQRAGARGLVNLDGNGSAWIVADDLTIGSLGSGNVQVTSAATLLVGDELILGASGAGIGTVAVTDRATSVGVDDLVLINSGSLRLSNEAWLTTVRANIGSRNGTLLVDSAAQFEAQGNVRVGLDGRGIVNVTDGGLLRAEDLSVGGPASATVSASGFNASVQLRGDLTIGIQGPGKVAVSEQALLTANVIAVNDGSLDIQDATVSSSQLRLGANGVVQGSGRVEAWLTNTSGDVRVGNNESLHFSQGTTTGAHANASQISVIGGELAFDRGLTNTGQIVGRGAILRFSAGLTNPGDLGLSTGDSDVFGAITNTGTITLDGVSTTTFYNAVSSTGAIDVTAGAQAVFLGGLTLGTESQINVPVAEPNEDGLVIERMQVAGDFTAEGILDIDLAMLEPVVSPGDSVTIDLITASNLLGNFASVLVDGVAPTSATVAADGQSLRFPSPALPGGFDELVYTPNGVQFSRFLTLPGDANGDREVGFADFLLLSGNFGLAGDWTTGDFDGNGTTEFADFLVLSAEFGNSLTAEAVASVPEPSSVSLIVLGLAMIGRRRKQRGAA